MICDFFLHGKTKGGCLLFIERGKDKVVVHNVLEKLHLLRCLVIHGRRKRVGQVHGLAANGLTVSHSIVPRDLMFDALDLELAGDFLVDGLFECLGFVIFPVIVLTRVLLLSNASVSFFDEECTDEAQ